MSTTYWQPLARDLRSMADELAPVAEAWSLLLEVEDHTDDARIIFGASRGDMTARYREGYHMAMGALVIGRRLGNDEIITHARAEAQRLWALASARRRRKR